MARKEVTLPKIEGGLGIRSSKAWKQSSSIQNIMGHSSKERHFWVQWVHQIYMNRVSFWKYQNKQEDSPILKQVIALRDEIIAVEETVEKAIH